MVAAGSGARLGGSTPKQYLMLGDRPVIDWSIQVAHTVCGSQVIVVVPAERVDDGLTRRFGSHVVCGGPTRAASVRAGLAAVPEGAGVVVVHDGARPFATPQLFAAVIAAVRNGADAAIPALLVVDTLKRVVGSRVVETVDRSNMVAVQTPQAFRASVLRAAHASTADATDDAALVEAIGGTVVWVKGSEDNRKLTTSEDLWWFSAKLATR